VSLRFALAVLLASGVLGAEEPKRQAPDDGALSALGASHRLIDTMPVIAGIEGSWSLVLQLDTLLTSRRFDSPQPQGLLAQEATRVLYGSTWTAMLGVEGALAMLASGGDFSWLAEAHYQSDWTFGVTAPACPAPGANAGCGVGIGGFGGLHARPVGSNLWYEVTGGWLEQRIASDGRRTLEESSWVLSPLAVTYGARARAGPFALDLRLGPGAYFGLHAAHLHPTAAGARVLDVPWHELYPLDAGVGLGARAELGVTLFEHVRLDAGVVAAPLALGTRRTRAVPELAPLTPPRDGASGIPWWRMLTLGVAFEHRALPLRLGASVFAAELSTRSIDELGQRGFMLRFDYALEPRAASRASKH
jgi:hypothetical protein